MLRVSGARVSLPRVELPCAHLTRRPRVRVAHIREQSHTSDIRGAAVGGRGREFSVDTTQGRPPFRVTGLVAKPCCGSCGSVTLVRAPVELEDPAPDAD